MSCPDKPFCLTFCVCSNVAEALISKGFASTVRHRQDDDHRSSRYDDLLAAEMRYVLSGLVSSVKLETETARIRTYLNNGFMIKSKDVRPVPSVLCLTVLH